MKDEYRNYLHNFIENECIFRCPPGYVLEGLPIGNFYTWQFYLRKAIYEQNALFCITEWLLENHDDSFQYAAMETAGPPMLSALKMYGKLVGKNIDGFGIRKDQKKYGLKNFIEGKVVDKPIIILDDLANSKSTIIRAKDICEGHGLEVHSAKTIVNKKEIDNVDGLHVESIFKISEFRLSWEEFYGSDELLSEELNKMLQMYNKNEEILRRR